MIEPTVVPDEPQVAPPEEPSEVPIETPQESTEGDGLPCLGGALPLAMLGMVWTWRKRHVAEIPQT